MSMLNKQTFMLHRVLAPIPSCVRLHRRSLLPVPALAAAAVKFGGAAIFKKVALTKVLQRVGPEKTIGELRGLNSRLRKSGVRYSAEVSDAAEESLNVLEGSLANLKGDERIGALWAWYSTLEKSNPTLAAAVLKTWLDTLPGMKWAYVLMSKGSGGGDSNRSNDIGNSNSSSGDAADRIADAPDSVSARASSVLEAIRTTHPRVFEEYHVVLIPREDEAVDAASADVERRARDRVEKRQ